MFPKKGAAAGKVTACYPKPLKKAQHTNQKPEERRQDADERRANPPSPLREAESPVHEGPSAQPARLLQHALNFAYSAPQEPLSH